MSDLRINIKSDVKRQTKRLSALERKILPSVQQQAVNRTTQKVRTETIRKIAKITGLKQKDIRQNTVRVLATKATLTGKLIAKAFAPNLIRFKARLIKGTAGITATAWRVKRVYKGTFIANQGRTVFKREGESRLPIVPVHGPSVRRTFASKIVVGLMRFTARTQFKKNFQQILRFQLSKLKR